MSDGELGGLKEKGAEEKKEVGGWSGLVLWCCFLCGRYLFGAALGLSWVASWLELCHAAGRYGLHARVP